MIIHRLTYGPFNLSGNSELSDVEKSMLSSKVMRINTSELYQHLNAKSILQQMVDRQLILPAKKEDAETYSHKYAQNLVAMGALFTMESPPTFLLSLCDILDATDLSCQQKLALKLRSGRVIL